MTSWKSITKTEITVTTNGIISNYYTATVTMGYIRQMPNSLRSRMNESLMYGSEDQKERRLSSLSSTTFGLDPINAWGEKTATLTGETLLEQVIS
jgi:hypothetical protein